MQLDLFRRNTSMNLLTIGLEINDNPVTDIDA
jgi:hypothetical protein